MIFVVINPPWLELLQKKATKQTFLVGKWCSSKVVSCTHHLTTKFRTRSPLRALNFEVTFQIEAMQVFKRSLYVL